MTENELQSHVGKLEKQLREFRIENPQGVVKGSFGRIPQASNLDERVANVEKSVQDFRLFGDHDVSVSGTLKDGFIIESERRGGLNAQAGLGVVVVVGCTNPAAMNYNPSAVVDDGTCYYLLFAHLSGNLRMRGSLQVHRGTLTIGATLFMSSTLSALRLLNLDGTLDFSSALNTFIAGPFLGGTLTLSAILDRLKLATVDGTLDLSGVISDQKSLQDDSGTADFSGSVTRMLLLTGGNYAAQDFENAILGTITSLPHPGSNDVTIGDTVFSDGSIQAIVLNYGADDFETFSTGTITSIGSATYNLGDSSLDASASFIT